MKTITLADRNGNPLHSRRVTNKIYMTASHAKVVGGRIIAVYAEGSSLPADRFGIVQICDGIIKYPSYNA